MGVSTHFYNSDPQIVMSTMLPFNTHTHTHQMYGGMRGIRGLVTETSLLDPDEVRIQWLLGSHTVTVFSHREFVSEVTVSQNYRNSCQRRREERSRCLRVSSSSCSLARFPLRARYVILPQRAFPVNLLPGSGGLDIGRLGSKS